MENINIKVILDEVFPKYAKDMIINIVEANTKINHLIAQHIIDTSNAEYKEMIKMVNQSVDNNKQENKFKNFSDDEIYAELKRRKAHKFLIVFLTLLSVKIIMLFHLLMMEELNSETMILLLSVLISNCNFYNSTVCEDSAINIYHSPSVICHI